MIRQQTKTDCRILRIIRIMELTSVLQLLTMPKKSIIMGARMLNAKEMTTLGLACHTWKIS